MDTSSRYIEAYAGAGAGLVGTLIGYPLDVIKGQMQARVENHSVKTIVSDVYRSEGIKSFYRGVLPPMFSLTILNMLNFSNYAMASRALAIDNAVPGFNPLVFIAGAAVGPAAAFVSTPFELLKIQLQFAAKNKIHYQNTMDAAVKIWRAYGMKSLYTGHTVNTYREMLFLGTYFTSYEHIKKSLGSSFSLSLTVPISGGLAGAIGWLVSFPLDAVKTNMQNVPLDKRGTVQSQSPSISSSLLNLIREKGFLQMYKGVGPSILRAFVVSSSRFSVYEVVVWNLS